MKSGIDIIELEDFRKAILNGGQSFLNQNFTKLELEQKRSEEHLAGKFACKEAIFKTGYLKEFTPLSIQITNNEDGSPSVLDANGVIIKELSVSISHSNSTAIAIAIWNN